MLIFIPYSFKITELLCRATYIYIYYIYLYGGGPMTTFGDLGNYVNDFTPSPHDF